MNNKTSKLRTWLSLSLMTFLVLILIFLGLPALFLIFQIPSFEIGEGAFWILRWQNNVDGSGISFNFVALLIIAVFIGLISLLLRVKR